MWLRNLHAGGAQRDAALVDLRALLLRALPKGIATWLSPEHPEFEPFIEDTAQETLLRVLERLDTFEGRSQFTTWVYKISVRVALNELRRRRWRDFSLEGLEEDDSIDSALHQFASFEPGPETVVERADILQRVQQIVAEELTERQRAAMHAINMQGVPMEEVARRMGTNRNALYKLLHDARRLLKHRLDKIMKSIFDWFKRRFKKWYQPDAEMVKILQSLAMTQESEISCDDVFAVLDEFAEAVRRGENVLLLMPLVRQHLDMCPDCREEYEALLRMLQPAFA